MQTLITKLAVHDFRVPHRKSANQWRDLLEAAGYFVSIVTREHVLRVYYWKSL